MTGLDVSSSLSSDSFPSVVQGRRIALEKDMTVLYTDSPFLSSTVVAASGSTPSTWVVDDRYCIGAVLGAGDFADVHSALDTVTGEEVAVKIMYKNRRGFSKTRFEAEVAILTRLNSLKYQYAPKFISKYEDLLEERQGEECCYIFQECIRGCTLQEFLDESHENSGLFPKNIVSRIEVQCLFRKLVESVGELHRCGIVHRDLKPANILIDKRSAEIKLIDYGSALEPKSSLVHAEVEGSPAITPPEIAQGCKEMVDGKAIDIWALGVLLYLMVYGRPPFSGSSVFDLFQNIVEQEPEYLGSISGDAWLAHADNLLRKLLCKEPSQRIKVDDILRHPWVSSASGDQVNSLLASIYASMQSFQEGSCAIL